MGLLRTSATLAAAAMLLAQPCFAASAFHQSGAGERRSGAFVGLSARLPLGTARPARPSLRLRLANADDPRMSIGARSRSPGGAGLEIGLGRSGSPVYFVGGRELRQAENRHQAKSSTTWLIVGGVVVTLLVLAAVASAQPTAGPPEGAFD